MNHLASYIRTTLALVLSLAALVGCVEKTPIAADNDGATTSHDGSSDTSPDSSPDATAACTGTLLAVSHYGTLPPCQPTYEAELATSCTASGETHSSGACGSYLAVLVDRNYVTQLCVYDTTSHALIGARLTEDSPSFCSNTSDTIEAGSVCTPVPGSLTRVCTGRDAGTDASTGGGDL